MSKQGWISAVEFRKTLKKGRYNGPRAVRAAGGKRADLGGLYVRSRMEANMCRYYTFRGWKWKYEPETFEFPIRRGTRFYTPDFRIECTHQPVRENCHWYSEVKGWADPKTKTQMKRMMKYHPEVVEKLSIVVPSVISKTFLELLDLGLPRSCFVFYDEIEEQGCMIDGWE